MILNCLKNWEVYPGAELSGKVNKMDVTVDEDITDEAQEWKITLVLTSERCSK